MIIRLQRFIKKSTNYLKLGHLDVAKYLVQSGADIEATDNYGQTAENIASENGNLKYLYSSRNLSVFLVYVW